MTVTLAEWIDGLVRKVEMSTRDQALVSSALEKLGFEMVPAPGGIVGGPQVYKISGPSEICVGRPSKIASSTLPSTSPTKAAAAVACASRRSPLASLRQGERPTAGSDEGNSLQPCFHSVWSLGNAVVEKRS